MPLTPTTGPLSRCPWCGDDPFYVHYHDTEWGVPIRRDDAALFERLCLEGAQAGLSWITILRKRDNYRAAFDGFDPAVVARYDAAKIALLMGNAGIVRNRAKIEATIHNAGRVLALQAEFGVGGFSDYLWSFAGGATTQNRWTALGEVPPVTDASVAMSKALKKRGFKFVGPTTCYALMQAVGMVNDHLVGCFRHAEVAALAVRQGQRTPSHADRPD
jgi:DNA-3-methyladenine glycosylase I